MEDNDPIDVPLALMQLSVSEYELGNHPFTHLPEQELVDTKSAMEIAVVYFKEALGSIDEDLQSETARLIASTQMTLNKIDKIMLLKTMDYENPLDAHIHKGERSERS